MLSRHRARAPQPSAYVLQHSVCKLAAVIEIGCFVSGSQIDDARPQPRWRIQSLGVIIGQVMRPFPASLTVHLAGVCFANDCREQVCCRDRIRSTETLHLKLEILWHQFPQDH
jgi:hypothetical protein